MPLQPIAGVDPYFNKVRQQILGWTEDERREMFAVHDALVAAGFRFKPLTDWLSQHGGHVMDVGALMIFGLPNGKIEFRVAGMGHLNIVYECWYRPASRPQEGSLLAFDARSGLSGASISARDREQLNKHWFDQVPVALAYEIAEVGATDPDDITRETRLADLEIDDVFWDGVVFMLGEKLPIDIEGIDTDHVPATFGDAVDLVRSKLRTA